MFKVNNDVVLVYIRLPLNFPGHILDLYCAIYISNAAPFCEKYAKHYFDAKHLEKGLNRRWRGGGGEGG